MEKEINFYEFEYYQEFVNCTVFHQSKCFSVNQIAPAKFDSNDDTREENKFH